MYVDLYGNFLYRMNFEIALHDPHLVTKWLASL